MNPHACTQSGSVVTRTGGGVPVLFDAQRYCIHRYPASLIDRFTLTDGRNVLVRPVLPQDASLHQQFVRELSPTSRYRRFHGPMRELSADTLEYLTQVDYRSHLALLAETFDSRGEEAQVAEVRYVRREADAGRADTGIADFAIAVADEWQGVGLGSRMFDALAASARDGGVRRLEGTVLADNEPMRALVRARGGRIRRDPDDARLVIAWLDLEPAPGLDAVRAIERDVGMAPC